MMSAGTNTVGTRKASMSSPIAIANANAALNDPSGTRARV
jgi:hypothetical protein